jgi:hypothetical protein
MRGTGFVISQEVSFGGHGLILPEDLEGSRPGALTRSRPASGARALTGSRPKPGVTSAPVPLWAGTRRAALRRSRGLG